MQIKVKVTEILPTQKGVSKSGKEWIKSTIIGVTGGEYPKIICFTCWNESIVATIEIGSDYNFDFDLESREYNGKYYTDVKIYKSELISSKVDESEEIDNDLAFLKD